MEKQPNSSIAPPLYSNEDKPSSDAVPSTSLPSDFFVNQLVFAKLKNSKHWKMARILEVSLENSTVDIAFIDSSSSSHPSPPSHDILTLPIHPETIQSIDTKRKRKSRINLEEEETAFYYAIGVNKKMRNTRTTIPAAAATGAPSSEPHTQDEAVPAPRTISKNQRNVQINEAATESSLKDHLALLKPFVSSKVYEKIANSPANPLAHHPVTSQPRNITKATLRDYQISGVSWLVNQYLKSINSILADEMGLGKTLQTISYISYLTTELNIPGPHLIVVPLSVLFNWVLEFRTFCPSLRIIRMHSNNLQDQQRLREILAQMARYTSNDDSDQESTTATSPYDVVITTYEMVKGKLETSLKRVYWRTMILDEGHRIKNEESLITQACLHYKARFKIILTGTPIQNNLHETYTLLHYLHSNIFNISDTFDDAFQFHGSDIHVDQHLVDKAHYLLRIFVLRRIKTEVEQKLPPKLETIVKCPMSPMQLFWSKRLLLRESELLTDLENKLSNEGIKPTTTGYAWKRLQSLLAQLRKAANHPYLFPDAEDLSKSSDDELATEEIVTASGKMMMLDRLLPILKAKNHRVVLFSQYTRTLDIIQDYLTMRGYKFARLDGSTHRVNREVRITQFNQVGSEIFLFLLSTRAGGEGVNLYTADTVILFDSDWNPQVDIQAMARVHRIGQTKIVHIYRFVTSGTVEERIVQRAQKKLYLDSLVNRGCTSQALELDKLRATKPDEDQEEDFGGNDEEISTMMSALKFGFGAVFSKQDVVEKQVTLENIITHEEILALIDRNRGIKPSHHLKETPVMRRANSVPNLVHEAMTPQLNRAKSAHDDDEGTYLSQEDHSSALPSLSRATSLTENQEESVASFQRNLSTPLVSLRSLNGEHHPKLQSEGQESLIIEPTGPSLNSKETDDVDTSPNEVSGGRKSRKSDGGGTLRSIASDWAREKQELHQNQRSIRAKQTRTETVHLTGVGKVQVLKVNQYSLEDGEPSVFQREMKGRGGSSSEPSRKGKDFVHQDFCQQCWDGGTLICCTFCPASYHPKCVGMTLKQIPSGTWSCPHHAGCGNCGKSKSSMSFSFRCEVCPLAFCEDCLPPAATILDGCARWEAQGFSLPRNCCFIQCSKECSDWIAKNSVV